MPRPVDKIIDAAKKAEGDRDLNRQIFEDCYEFLLPYRNTFVQKTGTFNTPTKQYDSTAMIAASNFVNTLQSNFTPVFQRWAELKAGPGIADEDKDAVNQQLSDINKTFFTYLNASNFSTASTEMYFDWGIGTGALWFFEGDETQPFNFVAAPLSDYAIEEGRFGEVSGIYKTKKIKAKLIEPTWARFNLSLPDELRRLIQDKPEEEVEVLEALTKDYTNFVWDYQVILMEQKHVMAEEQHPDAICLTPRWLKIPGFAYGVGPFMLALADIKTLNKMKELMLQHAALSVFGVYTVASNGAFNPNTAKIRPHAMIPVERNGGPNGPTIAPLPRAGDFQAQEFMITNLEDQIKQVMLDTKLPPDTAQPRSAFEISQRIREFQADIGSAYGRGMNEYIQPLFKRGLAILAKKGLVNLPPNFDIDNFLVQIQVVSQVAQTQALQDVERFTQNFAIASEISPAAANLAFNIEMVPEWLVEQTGGPAELLREEADKEALQATIAQEMAAMQAAEQQQGG